MSFVSRTKGFRTIRDTVYLYPEADLDRALAVTTHPFTYNGTTIVCSGIEILYSLYNDIFVQTSLSQPVGNVGFSLGVGTILEDLGKEKQFCLSSGEVVVRWRLVQQISPQSNPPIPVPGNSPVGTTGYVTTFCSIGGYPLPAPYSSIMDPVLVARMG